MPKISFLKPIDQPSGSLRLLNELRNNLSDEEFNTVRMIVAFAKIGPIIKLENEFQNWIGKKKSIHAIFGIDQNGTSKEALEYALNHFTSTHICHRTGRFNITFHPKIYLFSGITSTIAYIGSNNLTVGGTELNFESYVKLNNSEDTNVISELDQLWEQTKNQSVLLDKTLLNHLIAEDRIVNESNMRKLSRAKLSKKAGIKLSSPGVEFPSLTVIPPAPLPKSSLRSKVTPKKSLTETTELPSESTLASSAATSLVIQVTPHRNGEVFLSKLAVDQNPKFFGWRLPDIQHPRSPLILPILKDYLIQL